MSLEAPDSFNLENIDYGLGKLEQQNEGHNQLHFTSVAPQEYVGVTEDVSF